MKKFIIFMQVVLVGIIFSSNVHAAKTEVVWKDYENYRDIRESSMTRDKFRDQVFTTFEEHFAELAKKLPENYTLKIEVTDVDLAGDTRVASIHEMRVVKSIYPPSMKLTYQLLDDKGLQIKANDEEIRDLGFLSKSLPIKYRHKSFAYERNMLDDWFRKTFEDLYVK